MSLSSLRDGLVLAICPSINGGGGIVPDLSGRNNNGVLTNMDATGYKSYQNGVGLNFDGVNDRVSCGNSILSGTGDFSICCFTFRAVINDDQTLAGNYGSGTGNTTGVQLTITNQYTTPPLTANLLTLYLGSHLQGSTVLQQNTLYHLAAVRANGVVTLYVNGIADGSGTRSNSIASTLAWNLGAAPNYSGEDFTGILDDSRVYQRALRESEIRLLASEPGIGLRPERTSVFFGAQLFQAAWLAQSRNIIGGGVC